MKEMIDIYNEQRVFTGTTIPREGAHLAEGEYMLYVLAIVEDAHGRFLITQRAMDKHWAPGAWEMPGGGVLSGETTAQAVLREVREEVGLDVTDQLEEPLYTYTNVDLKRGDNYIVDMYHFKTDATRSDIVLQEEEAIDAQFASWDDIVALAQEGQFLHFARVQAALGK